MIMDVWGKWKFKKLIYFCCLKELMDRAKNWAQISHALTEEQTSWE